MMTKYDFYGVILCKKEKRSFLKERFFSLHKRAGA